MDKQIYGEDATEWLRRWDEGEIVWSVEMGGLGPGYEQAIQNMNAEFVRYALLTNPEFGSMDELEMQGWVDARNQAVLFGDDAPLKNGGYSGAQVAAAGNLSGHIYQNWPNCLEDVKDRLIQVSKNFPVAA